MAGTCKALHIWALTQEALASASSFAAVLSKPRQRVTETVRAASGVGEGARIVLLKTNRLHVSWPRVNKRSDY